MNRDQKFFDRYSLVLGGLGAIALVILVLAMKFSDMTQGVYTRDGAEYQAAVDERIRPFGTVYLPGDEIDAAVPTVTAAATPEPVATAMTGPQIYNSACNVCHGAGIGGAPILGDVDAWASRIAQGTDMLNEHAVAGFSGSTGVMPPKGGLVSLSDAEIHDAVAYMVGESQ